MKISKFILLVALLSSCSSVEIPTKYLYDQSVDRILMVQHTKDSYAQVKFYIKSDDKWNIALTCPAIVGKNGIDKTREGDGKTPTGDFEVTGAFGIEPNPGTILPYIEITPTTFACDEEGPYYNTIIDTAIVHHNCKGEDMFLCTPQYRYGLTIDYNPSNTYPNGSAIFIHCIGEKQYTAGCIALSEEDLLKIMKESHPKMRVIIY